MFSHLFRSKLSRQSIDPQPSTQDSKRLPFHIVTDGDPHQALLKSHTMNRFFSQFILASLWMHHGTAFVVAPRFGTHRSVTLQTQRSMFDKMFEEEGPLGKGITVGKVQVALIAEDRGENSIFALLEDNARWVADDDEPGSLADLAHEVCMSLLRKKDSWTAACSESKWFKADDYGKAEAQFNDWANTEAAKFEKV
jgi:hypothetical protein